MCSSLYHAVKDANNQFSYAEPHWLTPQQALHRPASLIFPNELVIDAAGRVVDVLLLAKHHADSPRGSLKLVSVLLSQLPAYSDSRSLLVLSLPAGSYFWRSVDADCIPQGSLRVGYDHARRQFCYIGRTKGSPRRPSALSSLIGTLTHFYEYIPAIVLQLHDLSRLPKQAPSLTVMASEYEVLCLRVQPASLKQLSARCLSALSERAFAASDRRQFRLLCSLPIALRSLLWPSYLLPGQCLVKNSRMRSSNGLYEVVLDGEGLLKLVRYGAGETRLRRQTAIHEKNLESVWVACSGVYLGYDNNQAMRKPRVLYSHDPQARAGFALELSDTGALRVVVHTFEPACSSGGYRAVKSTASLVSLLSVEDALRPAAQPLACSTDGQTEPSFEPLGLCLKGVLADLQTLPFRLFKMAVEFFKCLFQRSS